MTVGKDAMVIKAVSAHNPHEVAIPMIMKS